VVTCLFSNTLYFVFVYSTCKGFIAHPCTRTDAITGNSDTLARWRLLFAAVTLDKTYVNYT